jgi:hypothetical protein
MEFPETRGGVTVVQLVTASAQIQKKTRIRVCIGI